MNHKFTISLVILIWFIVAFQASSQPPVKMGAECTEDYYPMLTGKRVAVMSNHTGIIGNEHLVDKLKRDGINLTAIFAPEHGFRGTADAGEHVAGSVDEKTGVSILSLYDGTSGKPSSESMKLFDVMLIDIQDVGLRFYTYYITMCRLMEVCAEHGKKLIVLDRPNPNGHYVDGPILDMKHKSGVGWLPIPVVHGMTFGELACMINGERWLPEGRVCDLAVVKCRNYTHQTLYHLPIAPSPNLPNMKSVYLYPSTCLFEGTVLSLGRGTDFPFQVYGHPDMKGYSFSFTPRSVPGATNPPLLNKLCYGVDLRNVPDKEIWEKGFDLSYIIDAYNNLKMGNKFFTTFFEKLVGVDYIRKMIQEGKTAEEIRTMWKDDVEKFKQQRRKYLLYEEFGNNNAISSGKIVEKINLAQASCPWYWAFYSKKDAEKKRTEMQNQWSLSTSIGLKILEDKSDSWRVFLEPVQDDEGTGMFILRKGFTSEVDAIGYSDDLKRSLVLSNKIIKRGDGTFWVVWQDQMVLSEKTTAVNATAVKTTVSKTTATFAVSVGSFSRQSDAEQHVKDMERRFGQTCEIKETNLNTGRRTYRVAAFFTNDENDAKQYAIFWRRQIKRSDDDKNAAFAFDWITDKIL